MSQKLGHLQVLVCFEMLIQDEMLQELDYRDFGVQDGLDAAVLSTNHVELYLFLQLMGVCVFLFELPGIFASFVREVEYPTFGRATD